MTYSRQKRERAVDLYIKYEHSAADVIHELGYPSRTILYVWYRERLEEERTGVPSGRGQRHRRYSDEQKQAAVDHCLEYGRRPGRTMRMLGYPKSKELLMAWIDELAPGQRKLRHGPVPEELKKGGGGGRRVRQDEVTRGGRRAGRSGGGREKPETADACEVQGGTGVRDREREGRRESGESGRRAARGSEFVGRGRSGGRVGVDAEEGGGAPGPSGRAGRRRRTAAAGEEGARRRDRDSPRDSGAVGKRAGRRPGKPDQPGEGHPRQADR